MKNKILWYLLITVVFTSLITIIVSIVYTNNLNNKVKAETIMRVTEDIENKLSTFDFMLHLIEINLKPVLENSFLSIAEKLYDSHLEFDEWTPEELKEIARLYGVEDIYIIDKNGIVINTSFLSDMGLDLFSINEEFTKFIKNIYGSGEIATQRASISNMTGIIKMYSYYSPLEADYILEVSISLRDHVNREYGQNAFDLLIRDFFMEMIKTSDFITDIDIVMVSKISRWSLVNEGEEFRRGIDFILNVPEDEILIKKSDDKKYLYKLLYIEGAHFSHKNPFVIEAVLDFADLRSDIESYFINILIITFFIIFMIFIISSYLFNKFFLERIVKINSSIAQIERGKYEIDIIDKNNDELSYICKNINKMSRTILKRERELGESVNKIKLLQDYLSNIIDSIPSIIIVIDREHKISLYNRSAEKRWLLSDNRYTGNLIWKSIPFLEKYKDSVEELFESGGLIELYKEKINEQDEETYNIIIFPVKREDTPDAVVFMIDDITELERKDIIINQAQKMEVVGILSGGLAHDFNNVLGSMTGNLSFLKHKIDSDKKFNKEMIFRHLNIMEDALERAKSIINRLLTMSRKYYLNLELFEMNQCINDTFNMLKSSFADKNILFKLSPYHSKLMIHGDKHQIEQAIMNLGINSCHALTIMRPKGETEGGTLSIGVDMVKITKYFKYYVPGAKEGYYCKIFIMDNGIGMDRDTISRLFDPFFSTKDKGIGTGLGMTMVYNIIKKHNGFIDIQSRKSIGTTFNIYLPLTDLPYIKAKESETEYRLSIDNKLVLIIDDNELVCKTTMAMLQSINLRIIYSSSITEGIDLLKKQKDEIDLLILDIHTSIDPKSLLNRIISIKSDIRILMTYGLLFEQDNISDQEYPISFLEKPYSLKSLKEAVYKIFSKEG